ncbi:hypothetical protein L195_g063671, partial [Trifolium pratense]
CRREEEENADEDGEVSHFGFVTAATATLKWKHCD